MGKRGNGEGNIKKRKDGRYEVSVMVGYHPDGRRKRRSLYGKTRREVIDKLHALQQEINRGMDLDVDYTFEQVAKLWLRNKQSVSPATAKNYEYIISTLSNEFGDKKIRNIKPIHIEEGLLKLAQRGYSNSYLSKTRSVLKRVFEKAVANGWSTVNSALLAETVTSKSESVPKEPFSEDEARLILTNMPDNRIGHLCRLSLGTGLRPQCAVGLEPAIHISADGSELLVEQAVKSDGKGGIMMGPTKNGVIRRIPIPECVRNSALYLREHANGRFVFTSRDNGDLPVAMSTYRKYYKKVMEDIGIENPGGPHRLRHTYASLLNKMGVDPVSISKLCGHKKPKTTMEVYIHAMQPTLLDAAQRLSEAFTEED